MDALPPTCPPLPEFPPLFWSRVYEQIAYWQDVFAQPQQPGDAFPDQLRKLCVARIKTRLNRTKMDADKQMGSALLCILPRRRLPH
jgi:hypothetical protein